MRKHAIRIELYLNDAEAAHLTKQVAASGLSRQQYLRSLIMGETIRSRPPEEAAALLRQLSGCNRVLESLLKQLQESGQPDGTELAQVQAMQRNIWQALRRM